MSLSNNINRSLVLTSLLLFAGTRILGDSLLFLTKKLDTDTVFIWKIISTLSIAFSIIVYLFIKYIKTGKFAEQVRTEDYFKDLIRLISFISSLIVIKLFLPNTVSSYLLENSIIHLVFIDLVNIFFLFTGAYSFYFLYKWASMRKHKKTKTLTKALITIYIILFLNEFIESFYDIEIFSALKIILLFATVILIFLLYKNNTWLPVLPRNRKLSILWMSFLAIVISIFLTVLTFENESNLYSALAYFMGGTSVLSGFPFFCLIIYFIKIFFSAISALPTSEIVERKTYEIRSLAYLNKIIAETIDFDSLLKTVANLAVSSTGGHFSWIEIYDDNNKVDKLFSEGIEISALGNIQENTELNSFFYAVDKPLLVDSIPDEKKTNSYLNSIKICNSFIVVPLFHKRRKIGNIIVASSEEYGLTSEDINVLTAFSDNVNIAIENAKLLADSIEKEKYRQEISLAKDMQDKLLPRALPQINNYSISAYSKSAEVVGGDYYDFVYLKNGKLCLLIGDVSGKGISAAFYMAQLKGVVLSLGKESESASDLLKRINAALYGKMDRQMYITLSAILIDDEAGNISFARAGHMPTVIKADSGISFHTPKGFGIGLVPEKMFNSVLESVQIKLNPNDICFLFTDGVNELRNKDNEDFGYDALKLILTQNVYNNAGGLIEEFVENLNDFSQGNKQHDDITLLSIVYQK